MNANECTFQVHRGPQPHRLQPVDERRRCDQATPLQIPAAGPGRLHPLQRPQVPRGHLLQRHEDGKKKLPKKKFFSLF